MQDVDSFTPPEIVKLDIGQEQIDMVKSVAEEMIELNYLDPLYGTNANLLYDYWAEL